MSLHLQTRVEDKIMICPEMSLDLNVLTFANPGRAHLLSELYSEMHFHRSQVFVKRCHFFRKISLFFLRKFRLFVFLAINLLAFLS